MYRMSEEMREDERRVEAEVQEGERRRVRTGERA